MPLSKKRLKDAKIYLILDAQVLDYHQLLIVLKESVRNGIDIVQLRDKFGVPKDILLFCKHAMKITAHKVPFILNDRVDLAKIAGVDGIHVGQEDISCRDARKFLGSKALVGVSCQNLSQVRQAERDGADYVGFGSVFKTLTKPERSPMDQKLLHDVVTKAKIPVFAIGGINKDNIKLLKPMGVTRVAVCRDILLSKNIKDTIASLKTSV